MHLSESKAVEVLNEDGQGAVLLLCEHASNHIPDALNALGLGDEALASHIAWDPGAREVAVALSAVLDAPLVASCISRLVYDCNRPPEAPGAMPERSETTDVPGNLNLSEADRRARVDAVYTPFCDAVSELVEKRKADGLPTVLVTIHSFTPVYFGKPREVEIGILHDSDNRMADLMLSEARALPHRNIKRNDPYGPEDGVTHSLKLHGIEHGLPNVMLEVRNDLIRDTTGQAKLTEELLTLLRPALAQVAKDARHDA